MAVEVAGFVLAGGRSSRMGVDKALVAFAGEPLVARALRILRSAGLTAAIAGSASALEAFADVIPDASPALGPLGGICSALESCEARFAVFLPVDMPLVPPPLLNLLIHQAVLHAAAIALPRAQGFLQTFPAVLDRATLPLLRASLAAGRSGCLSAFRHAADELQRPIVEIDVDRALEQALLARWRVPAEQWFLNLNNPAELAAALRFAPLLEE